MTHFEAKMLRLLRAARTRLSADDLRYQHEAEHGSRPRLCSVKDACDRLAGMGLVERDRSHPGQLAWKARMGQEEAA